MMSELPPELERILTECESLSKRVVVMTCGIAGSGKSTLAKTLLATHPNFIRLSIDAYVHEHHGLFGVDYPKEDYGKLQDEAENALKLQFKELLKEGKRDIILDFSFYDREYRDEWRDIALGRGENIGPEKDISTIIVYFDATEKVLWSRIQTRSQGVRDADSAAEISRELLGVYVKGFEKPVAGEEGEVVVIRVV